jgi:uncharacterized membrane protein YfcA
MLALIVVLYAVVVIKNIRKTRDLMKKEKGSLPFYSLSLMVIMFFATFGISDTALAVSLYKGAKKVDDKLLPGTVITEAVFPVAAMAFAFLASIEVDMLTLVACIVAQSLGSYLGVRIIVGMDVHRIRYIMGSALLVTAILIIGKLFLLGGAGGSGIGLTSWELGMAFIAFFVFGGLNMIGMGAMIPCMAVLLLLGVDMKAVYPIVMASNTVSCCLGAYKFVQSGQYTRKAVIGSVFGIIGVLVAVQLVAYMNVLILQFLMILLLMYCSFDMFRTEYRIKRMSWVKTRKAVIK